MIINEEKTVRYLDGLAAGIVRRMKFEVGSVKRMHHSELPQKSFEIPTVTYFLVLNNKFRHYTTREEGIAQRILFGLENNDPVSP